MADTWDFKPISGQDWDFKPIAAPAPVEDDRSVTRLRVGAGVDNYQAGLYGVGEAVARAAGAEGVESWMRGGREANEQEANTQTRNAVRKGAVESWDQVQGVGDAANWVGGLAAQSLPYAAEFVVGGGLARLGSSSMRAAVNAGRAAGATEEAVTAAGAAQRALNIRSMVGGAAASYPSAVGDILQNQREQSGGETDLLSAAAGGVPYAALNLLGEGRALAQGRLFKNSVSALDNVPGIRGGLTRAGATALRTGVEEGVGEVGQEMINQGAGRMAVDPNAEMFSPDAVARYKESFAGGAALGGVMGGGLGGWRRSEKWAEAQAAAHQQSKTPTDILATITTTQGFEDLPKAATPPASPLGDLTPDWSTEPGAAPVKDVPAVDGAGLWPAIDDRAVTTGRERGALQMPAAPGRPGLADTMMVGRPGEVAATDADNAAMQDPGAMLARQRYVEQQQRNEEMAQAVEEEVRKASQRRQDAQNALVDRLQDGSPAIVLKPREINTYATLKSLQESGQLSAGKFAEFAGRMKEALQAEDKTTLSQIAKEVAGIVPPTKQVTEAAQNVGAQTVPGRQPVASGVAGGVDAQGSVAPAGRDAAAVDAGAGVPAGVPAAAAQVAVQPAGEPAGKAPAVVKPKGHIVDRLKGQTAVIGGAVDFAKLSQLLKTEDARLHNAVLMTLGIDPKDGTRRDKPLSAKAAAQEAGLGENNGSLVSRVSNALGLTKEVRNRVLASDVEATENPGTDMDAAEQVGSEDTTRRLSDEAPEEEGGELSYNDAGFGVVGDPGQAQGRVESPGKGLIANQKWYAPVQERGIENVPDRQFAEIAARAAQFAENNLPENRAALAAIVAEVERRGKPFQKEVILAYDRVYDLTPTKESTNEEVSADDGLSDAVGEDSPGGGDAAAESGADGARDGGSEERADRGGETPEPVVVRKKRRTIQRSEQTKPGAGSSASQVRAELSGWLPANPNKLVVVDSVAELPADIQQSISEENASDGRVQGFVHNGRAYLIAGNIQPGKALSVLLHEVGAHMGLENLLTAKEYMRLVGKIREWADLADNSQEAQIARKAIERVGNANVADEQVLQEMVAYFVEEAVNAGVRPQAAAKLNTVARWLSDVINLMKNALKKLGLVNARGLTAQDIVDLAYGAAHLEMQEDSAPGSGTAFSIAPAEQAKAVQAQQQSDALIAKLQANVPAPVQSKLTNIGEAIKKNLPAWLTNHQLVQQYKDKLKSLVTHVGMQQLMTNMRNELAQRAHAVAVDWSKLPKEVKQRMERVMYDATMKRLDPDVPFGEGVNKHLTAADRAAYDELKSRFTALGAPAQKVYRSARDELRKQWDDRSAAYNATINETYDGMIKEAKEAEDEARVKELEAERNEYLAQHGKVMAKLSEGPYFPLMRFGEYLAIGKSKAFTAIEESIKDLTGKERRAAEAQLEEMKKDADHYVVSAHEDKAAAIGARAKYKAAGMEAYDTLTDQHLAGLSRTSQHFLATMIERVTVGMDGKEASATKQALTSMYMQSLPEMHAMRREAQRKGVEGASTDMLRAFAAASETNSFYSSRLKYGKDLSSTLFQMKEEAKRNTDLQHIHREMEKRLALSMTYTRTPIQDAISAVTWTYQLGVSPASLAINMTQPWLVTVPVLAGRYGAGAAMRAMTKATADTAKILHNLRWQDDKIDLWSSIGDDSLKGVLQSENERRMVRELLKRGVLNDGAQNDNAALASGSNMNFHKFNRAVGWATQQVEMMNRTSTALAAFRLEMAKSGDYNTALDAAYDATMDTQFDYSTEGSARVMREGGGVPLAKLVFQFRRFQQGMLYLLVDNARKAFAGDKQARAALAYLTASSALSAGALGLPFIGTAFAIANMFIDDDDPDGDAETQLRNWLVDITGDKDVATTLAKGIPAALGADLSKRIGMSDVAAVFPMSRFENRNGREDVKEALFNAAGPSAGLAARAWGGVLAFESGNWAKGAEQMLPKAVGDIIKGGRYAAEGMTDTRGNPTGTDMSAYDIALRMFGVSPTAESNYYEGTRAINELKTATKDRMGGIAAKYKEALRGGDMGEVRGLIEQFNEDHPANPITSKVEQQWRKDARKDQKNRAAGSGIKQGTGKDKPYNEVARFAL